MSALPPGDTDNPFEVPPQSGGRMGGPRGEEAAVTFRAPTSAQAAEAAAYAPPAPGFIPIAPSLLEAHQAVADVLRGQGEARAAALAAEAVTPALNIQGVAIGLSAPPSQASGAPGPAPGETNLTVFVAEPTHPDAVQAVLVE